MTLPAEHTDTRQLIADGLAASGLLPPYNRLVELDTRLHAELERRIAMGEQRAEHLDRASLESDSLHRVLRGARSTLADDLGPGLRSAALHVHALARHCQWLTPDAEVER